MNAITLDTKTTLAGKIKFVSTALSKDATRLVLSTICICKDNAGYSRAVATNGRIIMTAVLSPEDAAQIPQGLYNFDSTKSRVILEANTEGMTYPNWQQVVPTTGLHLVSDNIRLHKDTSGKVNALIGAENKDPEKIGYIRNDVFVQIEKVANGQEWEMYLQDEPRGPCGPVKLVSSDLTVVMMPFIDLIKA